VFYLNLELPSDLRKLADPELFLAAHADRLVVMDEVQRKPELFPILRGLTDKDRRAGRFLILGSVSRNLIRQGGESLAGRIHYVELGPFTWVELMRRAYAPGWTLQKLWWRGGFPPAFLAEDDASSQEWMRDLMADYVARDLRLCGYQIAESALARFWKMLAHYHGQVSNASKLGQALDVSNNTVRKYTGILEQTFMVRVLRPFEANLKKRLVKSPKVYFRDSGMLHAVLEIDSQTDLYGHPSFGASFEGMCVEQIVTLMPRWRSHRCGLTDSTC